MDTAKERSQEVVLVSGSQYDKFMLQKEALNGLKELAMMYVEAEMIPDSYYHKPANNKKRWQLEGKELQAYNNKVALKVALAFAKGSEFGWGAQTCLEWIYIVGGKTSVYGAGVMSLIQQHPEYVDFHYKHFFDKEDKWEKTVGYVKTKKSGEKYHEVEYTRKMAIQANLFPTKKSPEGLPMVVKYRKDYQSGKMTPYMEYNNWCKHPYDMAYHKMIARVQKAYFPMGIEVKEDLDDEHFGEVIRSGAPQETVVPASSINKVREVEAEVVAPDEDIIKQIDQFDDSQGLAEYLKTIKTTHPGPYEHGLRALNTLSMESESGPVETMEEAEMMMDAAQEEKEDPVKEESAPEEAKEEEKPKDPEPKEEPAKNFVKSVSKWLANEEYADLLTEEELEKYQKLVASGFVSQEGQSELKSLLKEASEFKNALEELEPGMQRVKLASDKAYSKYADMAYFKKIVFAKKS